MRIPRNAPRARHVAPALILTGAALFAGCGDANRLRAPLAPLATSDFDLVSTIACSSNLHDPTNIDVSRVTEVYLLDADGTNPRRLTENGFADDFPTLSPDGKKIAFDSNRLATSSEPRNTCDMFVMNTDGSEQTFLARGASPTWSADGKNIAYHASASGVGLPIKGDVGAATFDSDIFTLNVDDALAGTAARINLTNSPDAIDDDADWSPNGQQIIFTSHAATDNHLNSVTAEIYAMSASGGPATRLTNNTEEERAPSWSPDGTRICYMCRHGGSDFEICVMNADGSGQTQLTDNGVGDATPTWSPDGTKILFQRGLPGPALEQFTMNPDGSEQTQITFQPASFALANWGVLRVHLGGSALRASR